jgi:hypothetical protein
LYAYYLTFTSTKSEGLVEVEDDKVDGFVEVEKVQLLSSILILKLKIAKNKHHRLLTQSVVRIGHSTERVEHLPLEADGDYAHGDPVPTGPGMRSLPLRTTASLPV